MGQVKIYSAEACPYAQRTRLILHEKGVDFELTEIDLAEKPDWLPEVSPYGKVPAIVHGDVRVYESSIINEYLDEAFPEPAMMPADSAGRALARIWIDYSNTRFIDPEYKLLREQDPELRAGLAEELSAILRFMETEGLGKMGEGPYWMGDTPSLIDFAFYPFFERFCILDHYRNFRIPEDCARLIRWVETMRFRSSVKAIENSDSFYIKRYAKYAEAKPAA